MTTTKSGTIWHETRWMSAGKWETYRTRSLTDMHAILRKREADAGRRGDTLRCDTSVEWPFGVYAEIVGTTMPTPEAKAKWDAQRKAMREARKAGR